MGSKVNYTAVGLFVILLGLFLIVVALWLTSMKHDQVTVTYVTYVSDDVSGLSREAAVRYNGVKVGYVDSLDLNPNDPQQVRIVLKVDKGTPVLTSTYVTLTSQGITGLNFISLQAKTPHAPMLKKLPGEKYPVIPSEPSLLVKLSTALQSVSSTMTALSARVKEVLSYNNQVMVTQTLKNVEKITQSVAENSSNISDTMKSAKVLFANSAKASNSLPKMADELHSALAAVKQMATEFSNTGRSMNGAMREAKTTVQNISQQLLPSTQTLMMKLNVIASHLERVSSDMVSNPSVLVRGKVPSPPGPGER